MRDLTGTCWKDSLDRYYYKVIKQTDTDGHWVILTSDDGELYHHYYDEIVGDEEITEGEFNLEMIK